MLDEIQWTLSSRFPDHGVTERKRLCRICGMECGARGNHLRLSTSNLELLQGLAWRQWQRNPL
jgi:hypothetical protein